MQWVRDNLGLISGSEEIETLASTVDDNGGVYFVPAFSGLFAPHWRSEARGVIAGLTRFAKSGHIARAVLEATAYQSREVMEAMALDSGVQLAELRVDGGMTVNEGLMQFQADLLDLPVCGRGDGDDGARRRLRRRPRRGRVERHDELRAQWAEDRRWLPQMPQPSARSTTATGASRRPHPRLARLIARRRRTWSVWRHYVARRPTRAAPRPLGEVREVLRDGAVGRELDVPLHVLACLGVLLL